jgi:trafficking protein particle complex subunit 11
MDEYPAFSLDHDVPSLVTLGISPASAYDSGLSAPLQDQAILIRSEVATIDSDDSRALLGYIRDRDGSSLPSNGRDATLRYRFRIRTAGRVCSFGCVVQFIFRSVFSWALTNKCA